MKAQESSPSKPQPEAEEEETAPTESPVEFEDVWDSKLEPQLRDIIKLTFLSGWGYVEWKEGSVGIYGIDVMVDTNLQMWLIEVNKCPCMAYSTGVTKTLIPKFMEDMAKVLVDKKVDPEAETGLLELLLEFPQINEPKEIRSAEEFTVVGKRMIEKKK